MAPPTNLPFQERLVRGVCVTGGTLAVVLAALGLFLPLLPTTPFLLLAAALYFRGSPRLYAWLLNNRWFGGYIRDYRAGRGVPWHAKLIAVTLLWITVGAALIWGLTSPWLKLGLGGVAAAVTWHLYRLPTRRPGADPGEATASESSPPSG